MNPRQQWLRDSDARYERLMRSPHYVYRAYDEHGLLLYVGCAINVKRRMTSHRSDPYSRWSEFYDHHDVSDAYPTLVTGRAAESAAIVAERPFFNRAPGNQFISTCALTPEQQRAAYETARAAAVKAAA